VSGVRAWLVEDRIPDACVAELFDVLDAGERRRAERKDTAEGRRRFVVAHGAVRRIVGEYLGAPPGELVWRVGPDGKPELDGPWTGVRVNLSHSGGLCLVALCESREVGVDVQRYVPGLDVVAMARRFFPAQEAASVAGAEDPMDAFARLWARKEAVSKAAGGRLTPVLRVSVESVASAFRVVDLNVRPGYRAAVALAGAEPFTVELAEWQP
jgi:4'-phosphopantetheinyl transferase